MTPSGQIERVRGDAGRLLVAVPSAPAQQPGFVVGEAVGARMVEPLQHRQWVAVVKNALFTLKLPPATTSAGSAPGSMPSKGDVLSLRVASLAPRLTFVLVDSAPATPASGAVAVQLSDAARTLSELVSAGERGLLQPAGSAAQGSMTVLLSDPAATPSERAQALAQAISHSGLFYESHLLAWAEGRMPLSSLHGEPQARLADQLKVASPATREAASAELGGLLHRQLDALDGKPLAFAGFAWPGQPAEWRVQREAVDERGHERRNEAGAERDRPEADQPTAWTTQIQLALPRLGALGAQLRVAGSQVTLALTLDNPTSAALLTTHRGRLASALQESGLTLTALTVHQAVQQATAQREQAEKS